MLNNLVNSTGSYCSSYNKTISCLCEDVTELFECYNEVKCQSDENCQSLQKLSTYIDCDNGNIDANDISASTAFINGLVSCGINSDSITANNVCATCKLETECVEAENITADNLNISSISANNLTGLSSLTVEGQATVDKLLVDEIESSGNITASSIETTTAEVTTLESTNIDSSNISATCVDTDTIEAEDAVIENACIGNLSTSCFTSDEIATSKISSTCLSVPKLETSGGITGTGTIDTTSSVWKEIRIPLFTGTVQFYTDEWKVTIVGGREFIWEDESLEYLKFISNDGEAVTVAVDWDGEVYYTYDTAGTAPVITLVDNTGTTPSNNYTYVMQDSGVLRGDVLIYQDKEFTNQGLTILGKLQASNLEITCSESLDCLSIENLYVGNALRSDNPIEVDICARNVCIASPCTYITDCLYTDDLYANNITAGCISADCIHYNWIQVAEGIGNTPQKVVAYCNGCLANGCNVCIDDNTVYSICNCACNFYGGCLNVKCANVDSTLTACKAITITSCSDNIITYRLSVDQCAKFNGPVYIYNNIYQCGDAYCTHAENVYTCSDTITMREGADYAGEAQIKVLKYDGTNNGIIQLGTDGTLRIGDETNCQPVLTRSEAGDITDEHVLVWDATNKCAKDGGDAIVTCAYVNCIGTACKTAACDYAVSCGHLIGTSCKSAACDYAEIIGTCCKVRACTYASCIGTCCKMAAYGSAIWCGHIIGKACKNAACDYAEYIGTRCRLCAETTAIYESRCACAFAVSCGHDIGTACKNAATSTKANCYGESYNCVACADLARKVILTEYTAPSTRYIYLGNPTNNITVGCSANFQFCPTCNVMTMGSTNGAAICLIGTGSCCMAGACTKLNPKVVFASTDKQCGCLQYSQYDSVHSGAGLCWQTNTSSTWFQTDCIYANKFLDSSGVQLPTCTYVSTVGAQCKTAACTYANTIATCCRNAACTYANTIATCCRNAACSFAAACAQAVVPETSTFAYCYGNNRECVAYANKVRVSTSSSNSFYKIPFASTTGTSNLNLSLYIDSGEAYPTYNPSTNVFCAYTACVAQTLAVRNANGGFRLGSYCIYIG